MKISNSIRRFSILINNKQRQVVAICFSGVLAMSVSGCNEETVSEITDTTTTDAIIAAATLESAETLAKINELKNEEDAELELWHTGLEEVERKVVFVDKTLFEPAGV